MKSQVSALLHVVSALLLDASKAYPALRGDFSKDFERIALNCRTRGKGFFFLDLPSLESMLLLGLDSGRLVLSGPASRCVSGRVRVPRLFSGLWLRVFDSNACLRQDVDVTAISFLRQLLTLGKKVEVACSHRRIQATVGAYHDIERGLRAPTLGWKYDSLTSTDKSVNGNRDSGFQSGSQPSADDQYSYLSHSDRSGCDILLSSLPQEALRRYRLHERSVYVGNLQRFGNVNLSQASDRSDVRCGDLPLFRDDSYADPRQKEKVALLNKIQQVADLIVGSLPILDPISLSEIWESNGKGTGFRHGPGAVAEQLKNWEKSQFPCWPHKLGEVFPYKYSGRSALCPNAEPPNHEVASRLIAVPKTYKGPRLIAAESTAHQWCQQLVLRFLFEETEKLFTRKGHTFFIDFRDQSKSGKLVLQASLDGSLATVDLSDASDRLTCWTVERVFRSNPSILHALHAARTRYLRDNISEVPSFLPLKKFASQGTAVTFPVMSITMLCIALGSCLEGDVSWKSIFRLRDQVRVFGDDIILPVRGVARLVEAMELLQLKVNTSKSYYTGSFRESCGVDGYLGYDITPVKPKTLIANSPSEVQSLIDASNNFFMKGYWHASEAVLGLIDRRIVSNLSVNKVGTDGLRGLASFTGSTSNHLQLRWNENLHRIEARTWISFSKPINKPREDTTAILDFMSRRFSALNPRVVSEYAAVRVTKSRYTWEPVSHDALMSIGKHCLPNRVFSRLGQSAKEYFNVH